MLLLGRRQSGGGERAERSRLEVTVARVVAGDPGAEHGVNPRHRSAGCREQPLGTPPELLEVDDPPPHGVVEHSAEPIGGEPRGHVDERALGGNGRNAVPDREVTVEQRAGPPTTHAVEADLRSEMGDEFELLGLVESP